VTIATDLGLTESEWAMVRATCAQRATSAHASEDLVQEAAIELHQKRHKWEGLGADERCALVRRIVADRLTSVHRNGNMVPESGVDGDAIEAPPADTGASPHVPWRPWICMRHYWVLQEVARGKSTLEIAAAAGVNPRTIRRWLVGARSVLATYVPTE
jgi:DNA-directed RNA polymerase specialized sigma24 family protein